MALPEIILWLIGLMLRFLLLLQLVRWRINHKWFLIYVSVTLVYGIVMFPLAVWCRPSVYFYTYWSAQTLIYILHMLVGLGLLYQNGGMKWLRLGGPATLFLVLFMHYWTQVEWSEWQKMVMWSDSAVMIVLVWALMRREMWLRIDRGIGLGLGVGTVLHLCLSMLQGGEAPVVWIRLSYQLASITSLMIWLVTVSGGQQSKRWLRRSIPKRP